MLSASVAAMNKSERTTPRQPAASEVVLLPCITGMRDIVDELVIDRKLAPVLPPAVVLRDRMFFILPGCLPVSGRSKKGLPPSAEE